MAEKAVVLAPDAAQSDYLRLLLQGAGYQVMATESVEAAVAMLRAGEGDVALIGTDETTNIQAILTAIETLAVNFRPRVIVLSRATSTERAAWLDRGADEVVALPYEADELLARIRAQMRVKRTTQEMDRKVRNAEESYQVAQTAFQALAVTEKMTRDAFSLEKALKFGVAALIALSVVIAGIFFLFSRKAEKVRAVPTP